MASSAKPVFDAEGLLSSDAADFPKAPCEPNITTNTITLRKQLMVEYQFTRAVLPYDPKSIAVIPGRIPSAIGSAVRAVGDGGAGRPCDRLNPG